MYDNNHIDINILNDKILESTNIDLNLNYNIYKNNLNVFDTNTIKNNANINHNLNTYNHIFINKGIIELSSSYNNYHAGCICYNENTNKINIIKNNKWSELFFIDQNNTGIINNINNNNNTLVKIKNNNVLTLKNNVNILNNCFFTYNTHVINNTNIVNNLNLSNIIHINNIPIQYYRNLLRTYNSELKNGIHLQYKSLI